MSPFGLLLRNMRLEAGLTQAELARDTGYEQTHFSALELGNKGPPRSEFVEVLVRRLELNEEDRNELLDALDNSQRHMTLRTDASEELFVVFNEFRRQLEVLHPEQIRLIGSVLALRRALNNQKSTGTPRLIRSRSGASAEGKEKS